jgi:hypothetical protein
MRISWLCLVVVFALAACPKKIDTKTPTIDPVKAEELSLEKLKADHLAKISKNSPDVVGSYIYLVIEAQARLALYKLENPTEAKSGKVSEVSAAIRLDTGRYLSELRKRKLHLTPAQIGSQTIGLTPLGAEINRITTYMLLASSNPTTQPGSLKGNIDMLRLYYEGSKHLDITRKKPAPKELAEISVLGIDVCDAILELYSAPNLSTLSGLKQDKKLIASYKRNITVNRKQFTKAAGLVEPPKKDPKKDPK